MSRIPTQDRLSAKVASGIPLETGMVDVERVLRREHKIRPGGQNDFMVMDRQQFVEAQQQSMAVFAYLLGGVASVSLLVGGIGVMNIMLVSVPNASAKSASERRSTQRG